MSTQSENTAEGPHINSFTVLKLQQSELYIEYLASHPWCFLPQTLYLQRCSGICENPVLDKQLQKIDGLMYVEKQAAPL